MSDRSSIDSLELKKFDKNSDVWRDADGEFQMLHKINPVRIDYLLKHISEHFDQKTTKESSGQESLGKESTDHESTEHELTVEALRAKQSSSKDSTTGDEKSYSTENNEGKSIKAQDLPKPFANLSLVDIGCGGGLISVPMASYGADVTALDLNQANLDATLEYAKSKELDITIKNETVETHLKSSKKYDVVICLEVIEHVANLRNFLASLAQLLKQDGILIISTINRTKKSYLLAILMAEYILGWIKPGTHDHKKFIKPSELSEILTNNDSKLARLDGLSYSVLSNEWYISDDIDINYFAIFHKG